MVFKEEIDGTKKFAPDLVGTPGRDTWSGHLVGTPGGDTSYQHESSGSGGGSSRLPTPQTGNMITHTHSHYTHTERHHKNPKDKSFGKKYNRENDERQVPEPFTSNSYDQTDKPPNHGEKAWNQNRRITVQISISKLSKYDNCCQILTWGYVHGEREKLFFTGKE